MSVRQHDRARLLEQLAAVPGRVADAARAAEAAGWRSADGAWSPAWAVLHLVVVEEDVWQRRLRDLEEPGMPQWAYTEPDLGSGPGAAPLAELAAAFARARATTLETVGRLGDAGWARRGIHETFGELDVEELLREALRHDEQHLTDLGRR